MQSLRITVAVLGGVIVLGTSASVLQTLVTPGGRVGRMFKTVNRMVDRTFVLLSRPFRSYEQRDRVLALEAPVALATMLGCWLLAYYLAFGLLLWPATGNLAASLRESGSSLLTLGFASTGGGGPAAIDFV